MDKANTMISGKIWPSRFFIVIFLVSLFCSFPLEAVENNHKRHVMRIGTVVPGQMGWAKRAKELIIPMAKKASDGNFDVRVFWGGIRGDDEDIIMQIKDGRLEGGAMSGYGATLACPEMSALSLPFLFENYQEVDYVREQMLPVYDTFFENHGFKLFLWIDQDFDQLYSFNLPMTRLQDFRDSVFVHWYGDVEKAFFHTLGASSIPSRVSQVSTNIYQGKADTVFGPALWALGAQLFTRAKTFSQLRFRYSPVVVILSSKAWLELPEQHRNKALAERSDVTKKFTSFSRMDSNRCIAAMKVYGIKEAFMDPEDEKQLKALARVSWDQLIDTSFPRALLDEIMAHLAAFRKQAPVLNGAPSNHDAGVVKAALGQAAPEQPQKD